MRGKSSITFLKFSLLISLWRVAYYMRVCPVSKLTFVFRLAPCCMLPVPSPTLGSLSSWHPCPFSCSSSSKQMQFSGITRALPCRQSSSPPSLCRVGAERSEARHSDTTSGGLRPCTASRLSRGATHVDMTVHNQISNNAASRSMWNDILVELYVP